MNRKIITRIGVVIFASLVLYIAQSFREDVDASINNFFVKMSGGTSPDTNIIIIHFSEQDIAQLGPWPIKRNYYALLINQLTKLEVKKIGIEIFLSSRFVTQSVYDNLLKKEIERSGRVVLSSIAGRINEINNLYLTDSLSFPSPKLLNEEFLTGHLNYIRNSGYSIPLIIRNNDIREKAFSLQLAGIEYEAKSLEINFISRWAGFKKYSALEFTDLVFNKSSKLNKFKNKVVIIGISDPQIAVSIQTPFDDQLPGIALHAFALDNIINSRGINNSYYIFSILLFPILILAFIFYRSLFDKKVVLKYLLLGIFILTFSFLLVNLFYWKTSLALFVIPFIALIACDFVLHFLEGQSELKDVLDETTLLRNLLHAKENQLLTLQKEFDTAGEEPSRLVEKIKALKSDIERLKENEDDRSEAKIVIEGNVENFNEIVYTSTSMANVIEIIKKAAPTDATILITGESGTGKELVAHSIHLLSKRKDKKFVAVNCGALTDSILESELFGYVRGAFTGAFADKQGRFELANEGTIFLDEVGETSENFQVKMLRVLQSGEIEKVGSTTTNKVNVRVVAATNKDLSVRVKEKKFREDLYYRLNVIMINIPPLRERKEDINVLAKSFLQAESPDIIISKAVLQALNDYKWKGNVRELQSVIKRAAIFAKSEQRNFIRLSDLPKEIVKETRYTFDDLVIESLRSKKFSHSSITETANELGNVNRTLIAENFRGVILKSLVENEFNVEQTVLLVSGSDEDEIHKRVQAKIQTFLSNIENDLKKIETENFAELKNRFSSKYKNLPVKFHQYLDEVIKWNIKNGIK